jgi:hypothetical protein
MEIETLKQSAISSSTPPFRLSSQAIKDFQAVYFQEHNVHICDEEANRLGMKLLRLFKVVYRPIRSDLESNNYGNK